MTSVSTLVLGALIIAILLYIPQIMGIIRKRLRLYKTMHEIPGPMAIPILGSTWQFKWKTEELVLQMRDWGQKYSAEGHGLVKFWMAFKPLICCIRPDTAKVILDSQEIITKGPQYEILIPWLGTGLLISTGEKWRNRRKLLTPTFHFNVLNEFVVTHDYQAKIFTEQLEKFALTGEQFDIFPYVKRCALDIICETSMGCTVSAQTEHNHPYVLSVAKLNEIAFLYQRMPWMWIKPIWYLSGYGGEFDRLLKTVTDFTRKVIDDRMQEAKNGVVNVERRKAFLDLLLELSQEGKLSYEDIREEVDTFMFEGHDTTAASMGWTLWCLAHNPDVQSKVFDELDEVFGNTDRDCSNEDLKRLKYLEKVIKESLRLRPSVPNMTRRVTKDIELDGHLIPEGCTVLISPQILHLNPKFYPDPEVFDPERFSEENISKRNPFHYIPFSAGARNCIGQKFALMEEKTLLSWFFRRYSISTKTPYDSNVPLPEIILRPSIGFPVSIQKRS